MLPVVLISVATVILTLAAIKTLAHLDPTPRRGRLSGPHLKRLADDGVIQGVRDGAINAHSIDLHLGNEFIVETRPFGVAEARPRVRFTEGQRVAPTSLSKEVHGKCVLGPGQSCLATTREVVNLPDDICGEIKLKSTAARFMLGHKLAGHIDGGFCGQITLELTNESKWETMVLYPDDAVVQLVLDKTEPSGKYSYSKKAKSKYQGQVGVTAGRDLQ